ncbi:MAG: Holliday junction branch migration protein RuvA [Woeseiaceae bacterium]
MIGTLRGTLAAKLAPRVLIDCNGVGYEVETPMSTFLDLPPPGKEVFLYTHLHVREDAQTLYGFATEEEKRLFRALLKVSGVGARMSLSILSAMTVSDFRRCVQHENTGMLVKIPGVGRKTAERLIIEMRDRLDRTGPAPAAAKGSFAATDARGEAVDALVALGYKPQEVRRLLANLDTDGHSVEDIIRQALRQAVT